MATRLQQLAIELSLAAFLSQMLAPAWAQTERPVTPAGSPTPSAADFPILPALGESVGRGLSPGAERHMGDQAMREIWADPDVVDDPVLLEYVQVIWSALLQASRERGELTADLDAAYAWTPFLIRDPEINAFAMPGGYIGVYMGLIAMTETRDELASVLAHELSHVTQRHIARQIDASPKFNAVSIASMILGALAASRNPEAAQAIMVTGQAMVVQGELSFSRQMEREADRIGLSVLTGAGYSPLGMAGMFEKLEQASRLNDDNNYPFLRDHPLTTERIGEARERLGVAAFTTHQGVDHLHALMQARARVLMDHSSVHLQQIMEEGRVLDGPRRPTSLPQMDPSARAYEVALAATQLRRWDSADRALSWGRSQMSSLPAVDRPAEKRVWDLLEVETLTARGVLNPVQSALLPLQNDHSRPVLIARARCALLPGASRAMLQDVAAALEDRVAGAPQDSLAWSLLSPVWRDLNQPLRAIRAEAESYAAHGDLGGAIDRLRAAQKISIASKPVDFIEASVIDNRLRQLQGQRAQEEREKKRS